MNVNENFKIRKSEPCPCGSNIIYKDCCFKNKDKPSNIEEFLRNPGMLQADIVKKLKTAKQQMCIHPDKEKCSKSIKGAHTLQNNGVLSRLAVDNHVIILEPGISVEGININIKKEGRNRATTFKGFCDFHDSKVFAPIETKEYHKDSSQQNFLYAYRAFANEYYKKLVQIKIFRDSVKQKPSILKDDYFVTYYRNMQLLERDVEETLNIFNQGIISENYDIIQTYVRELDYQISFAVAFAYAPYIDFEGNNLCYNHLAEMLESRLPLNYITIIPQERKSFIQFSCFKQDYKIFEAYFNQIANLDEPSLKRVLNNLIPEYSESIVVSPRLWERFSLHMKETFINKVSADFINLTRIDDFSKSIFDGKLNLIERSPYNLFRKF